ncbi:hypothetical protein [Kitasatospora kifunensis]|uniref:Uncharacterized protein n=1 Tax=Kitasatospora kifunensis TaxID=58351 RepID=A0A7W7VSX3_KITKI|nr:hypothetical protein [Kitasatospora kifunensis]MBB4921597.1 hypothetical protein [Kitasatospora kifunensis]
MNDSEHTGRLPATRTTWALLHPLLTAISQAGVPFREGDLERLHDAAVLGPDFVQALTRWIIAAHRAAPPNAPTVWAAGHSPRLQLAPVPPRVEVPRVEVPRVEAQGRGEAPGRASAPVGVPTAVPGSRVRADRQAS